MRYKLCLSDVHGTTIVTRAQLWNFTRAGTVLYSTGGRRQVHGVSVRLAGRVVIAVHDRQDSGRHRNRRGCQNGIIGIFDQKSKMKGTGPAGSWHQIAQIHLKRAIVPRRRLSNVIWHVLDFYRAIGYHRIAQTGDGQRRAARLEDGAGGTLKRDCDFVLGAAGPRAALFN